MNGTLGARLFSLICLFLQGASLSGDETHFATTHTQLKLESWPDDVSLPLGGERKEQRRRFRGGGVGGAG